MRGINPRAARDWRHRVPAAPPAAPVGDGEQPCSTSAAARGIFTRRFAREAGLRVTGLDPDRGAIDYARAHASPAKTYVTGDARDLPYPDASFDFSLSVTALCFIEDQKRALSEIIRIARKGFALGLLNRHSLLFRTKAARAAPAPIEARNWHTADEVFDLLSGLAVEQVRIRTAVFLPSGTAAARLSRD